MKKRLLATGVLLSAVALSPAVAQSIGPSTLNAAGGSAIISGNTHEYAIGSVPLLPSYTSATLVITPGVVQPLTPVGINDRLPALTGVQIFPNPASSVLYVAPALGGRGLLEMRLHDATGKVVRAAEARLSTGTEQQSLSMENLAASTYLLTLVWTPQSSTASPAASSSYTVQKLQ